MALFSPSEISYSLSSLLHPASPVRQDSRLPSQFRPIHVHLDRLQEEGRVEIVAPTANGSAIVNLGGTVVQAGGKLEVEDVPEGGYEQEADDQNQRNSTWNGPHGRISFEVECSSPAFATLPPTSPDPSLMICALLESMYCASNSNGSSRDNEHGSTHFLLPPLTPSKRWLLRMHVVIFSAQGGNAIDAALIATRTALNGVRVPRVTRGEYLGLPGTGLLPTAKNGMDVDEEPATLSLEGKDKSAIAGLVKSRIGRGKTNAVEFELEDGEDEGEEVSGLERLPVGVGVNILSPNTFFLDPSPVEEVVTQFRGARMTVCIDAEGDLCGIDMVGEGEVEYESLRNGVKKGAQCSLDLIKSLNATVKSSS